MRDLEHIEAYELGRTDERRRIRAAIRRLMTCKSTGVTGVTYAMHRAVLTQALRAIR